MAEFRDEKLNCRFVIPDRPTVREQMRYQTAMGFDRDPLDRFVRLWEGARTLITEWDCPRVPDPNKVNLDEETDPTVTSIVFWVGATVTGHIADLEDLPKNS